LEQAETANREILIMEITQGLRRAVQFRGEATATIFGDRRQNWSQLLDHVSRLAAALQSLGVSADDRVAVLSTNSDRFIECLYGIPWAGGVMLPLNFRLREDELVFILNDAKPRVIFVESAFLDLYQGIAADIESIEHVIIIDDEGKSQADCHAYSALRDTAVPVPDAHRGGDELIAIFYTGGTTGTPKGVMLSHDNLIHFALGFLAGEKMTESLVHLHVAPMFHMSCIGVFFTTLAAGTHIVLPRFEPQEALAAMSEHGVTHCLSVPIMIEMMLFHPDVGQYDLSNLRMLGYGGSPMPYQILRRAQKEFPDIDFAQGYGMTEAPGVSYLGPEFHHGEGIEKGWIRSAGRSIVTCEMIVCDDDGKELPLGQTGEIRLRGPVVMRGYWKRPDLTAEVIRDGWYCTGDLGHMDEYGFVYITDRLKDMIISGGENVFSTEVEQILYEINGVQRCAVIGIPDDKWGEAVHAIIECKAGAALDENEVITFCQSRIAGYKCPRSVCFSDQPLPLSAAGKVLKAELRAPYWEGREKQI
jgi:acyl-CoA synthetase (AMP-forming)/AMP-acid ligase II